MKNFLEKGDVIPHTVPAGGVQSGAMVVIGTFTGVAMTTGVEGDVISVALNGVYSLPKVTGTAITKGAKVYFDDTAKNITTTASGNTFAGYAWAAEASGATTVSVKLAN